LAYNNLWQNSTQLKEVFLGAQLANFYARPEKLSRFSGACLNFPRVLKVEKYPPNMDRFMIPIARGDWLNTFKDENWNTAGEVDNETNLE